MSSPMMVGLWDQMLWTQAMNVMWLGLPDVAWCVFRGPTSIEACTSMRELIVLASVMDG